MSTPIDPAFIAKLLKEEAEQPTRTRGPRVDPTSDRSLNGWFKLPNHICVPDCPHRTDPANPTARPIPSEAGGISGFEPGNACWNPNCKDPRHQKEVFDRGVYVVSEVKGQWICRYCYQEGYLA